MAWHPVKLTEISHFIDHTTVRYRCVKRGCDYWVEYDDNGNVIGGYGPVPGVTHALPAVPDGASE